jgi:hypothetical protein
MPEGLMVAIMFEEGDEMPEPEKVIEAGKVPESEKTMDDKDMTEELAKILELDPTAELAQGESQACQSCARSLGFKFEELWGGHGCSC